MLLLAILEDKPEVELGSLHGWTTPMGKGALWKASEGNACCMMARFQGAMASKLALGGVAAGGQCVPAGYLTG